MLMFVTLVSVLTGCSTTCKVVKYPHPPSPCPSIEDVLDDVEVTGVLTHRALGHRNKCLAAWVKKFSAFDLWELETLLPPTE